MNVRARVLLRRAVSLMGVGLIASVSASRSVSAQNRDLERCTSTLQQCGNMLDSVRDQRDTAVAAQTQCEASLKEAQQKLELVIKAGKPGGGGLTHRRALELMELSMKVLEKAPASDTSPAELLRTTQRLRAFQEKATGLSLKLTDQATKTTNTAVAAP